MFQLIEQILAELLAWMMTISDVVRRLIQLDESLTHFDRVMRPYYGAN